MKIYHPIAPRAPAMPRRIPPFQTVIGRERHDGWSPLRQARFIGYLAETRSVSAAARRVGMARETAYQLRRRPGSESFRAAWDAALGRVLPPRPGHAAAKVTPLDLRRSAERSWWKVKLIGGKFTGLSEKHDNSALLRCLAQIGRAEASSRRLVAQRKVT